jgi:alpha-tubulin suppressor-like RCC1 family protein
VPTPTFVLVPVQASAVSGPVLYSASAKWAQCVLRPSGDVECFGANDAGEAANGGIGGPAMCADPSGCNATPVKVPLPSSKAVELSGMGWSCGGAHLCARTPDRKVYCWGNEATCGPASVVLSPKLIPSIDDAAMISSGNGFDCALRGDGTVWCWGYNGDGELGQGDTKVHLSPVKVKNLAGVTVIGTGLYHACARAPDGVYCWGKNDAGQIGNGGVDGLPVLLPAQVAMTTGFDDVVQIVGGQVTTCALTSAGTVFCWGQYQQVGNGGGSSVQCNGGPCVASPTKANVTGVVEIAMGDEFVLARLSTGFLMAWGGNTVGQIGIGMMGGDQVMPIQVWNFP